jgi:DNA-3-methyladenine glycosylase
LGKYLVRNYKGEILAARIVETEAYTGARDPGSHAYTNRTPRNEVMFEAPGRAYVYFCYGNHFLLNIVTEKEGTAGAVLIRAAEPVSGIKTMMKLRRTGEIKKLTNGPGKLTMALAVDKKFNRADMVDGRELYVASSDNKKFSVTKGPRIGIKKGLGLNWRFCVKGSGFLSA